MAGDGNTHPEFYGLDFESLIFSKVAEKSQTSPTSDLLDSIHAIHFAGCENIDA